MPRSNAEIIKFTVIVGLSSYLGWLNFTSISELFPGLATVNPLLRLLIGIGGIFILVKVGLRKQG